MDGHETGGRSPDEMSQSGEAGSHKEKRPEVKPESPHVHTGFRSRNELCDCASAKDEENTDHEKCNRAWNNMRDGSDAAVQLHPATKRIYRNQVAAPSYQIGEKYGAVFHVGERSGSPTP